MMPAAAAGIAAAAALAAWRAGWLTAGGGLAGALVGTAVLWGTGLPGLALLGLFVVSGSLLTRRGGAGGRRNHTQVSANGWTAAAGSLLALSSPAAGWAVLVGGLAAAQADTWATEIGHAWGGPPRLITSGRRVEIGVSGGITLAGTLGGIAGAACIGILAWLLGRPDRLAAVALWAGTAGMLMDSLIGATLQGRYVCPACGASVETGRHCGRPTALQRGYRWMTNDTVNALGTAAGAALAVIATA